MIGTNILEYPVFSSSYGKIKLLIASPSLIISLLPSKPTRDILHHIGCMQVSTIPQGLSVQPRDNCTSPTTPMQRLPTSSRITIHPASHTRIFNNFCCAPSLPSSLLSEPSSRPQGNSEYSFELCLAYHCSFPMTAQS